MSDIITLPETAALALKADGLRAMLERAADVVEVSGEASALVVSGMRVQQLLNKITDDLDIVDDLVIDSADMLAEAERIAGRLAAVTGDSGEIEKERKLLTAPLNAVVKLINGGYQAPREYVAPKLNSLKVKILAWHNEQRRLQAVAEAAARAAREKAAREAAELEAKARAEAEALMVEAQKAQASGATIVAQELAQQAAAVQDQGRADAVEAVSQARQTAPYAVGPGSKAKGVRGTWEAELVHLDAVIIHVAARLLGVADGDTLRALVPEHCLARADRSLAAMLRVDEIVARNKVRAEQEGFNVPGMRADYKQSVATRRAATV